MAVGKAPARVGSCGRAGPGCWRSPRCVPLPLGTLSSPAARWFSCVHHTWQKTEMREERHLFHRKNREPKLPRSTGWLGRVSGWGWRLWRGKLGGQGWEHPPQGVVERAACGNDGLERLPDNTAQIRAALPLPRHPGPCWPRGWVGDWFPLQGICWRAKCLGMVGAPSRVVATGLGTFGTPRSLSLLRECG